MVETSRTPTSASDTDAPSIPAPSIEWKQIGDTIHYDRRTRGNVLTEETPPIDISHDGTRIAMTCPRVDSDCPASVKMLEFDGKKWNEKKSFSGECKHEFGESVAISGDGKTLAIPYWGRKNDYVEVHQYTEGDGWKSNRLESVKSFGKSIALSEDGSRIAIGAPISRDRGHVQVFQSNGGILKEILQQVVRGSADWATLVSEFEGNPWKPLGQLIIGDSPGDRLGDTVSMSADGNIVAIGSPEGGDCGDCRGSVKVFRYYPVTRTTRATKRIRRSQSAQGQGRWLQIGQKIRDVDHDNWFGEPLSMNAKGDIIAVGSLADYVKVFHLQGKTWRPMGILSGLNMCGNSVSLAPNTHRIAVGPDQYRGEYVYFYDYNGTDWIQVGKIAAHSSECDFSKSVSLSSCGKRVAIASEGYDDNSKECYGCVKVYQCS